MNMNMLPDVDIGCCDADLLSILDNGLSLSYVGECDLVPIWDVASQRHPHPSPLPVDDVHLA